MAKLPLRSALALAAFLVAAPTLQLAAPAGPTPGTFADVPAGYWAEAVIESTYAGNLVDACGTSPLTFCPEQGLTRAMLAKYLLRAMYGAGYLPPPATGTVFGDVPASHPEAAWIEQLFAEGLSAGCGGGSFCPAQEVTRPQMAVFLLRARHGVAFTPPPATGTVFADTPASDPLAPWIEQLYAEGITVGCLSSPFRYCADRAVSRAETAMFLSRFVAASGD
jgi:hypothetical protein